MISSGTSSLAGYRSHANAPFFFFPSSSLFIATTAEIREIPQSELQAMLPQCHKVLVDPPPAYPAWPLSSKFIRTYYSVPTSEILYKETRKNKGRSLTPNRADSIPPSPFSVSLFLLEESHDSRREREKRALGNMACFYYPAFAGSDRRIPPGTGFMGRGGGGALSRPYSSFPFSNAPWYPLFLDQVLSVVKYSTLLICKPV